MKALMCLLLVAGCVESRAQSRFSANYVLWAESLDSGGQHTGSSSYSNEASLGQIGGRGASTDIVVLSGYVSQLGNPPVAGADTLARITGQSGSILVSSILANDSDPDGGQVSIGAISVTSSQGGTISVDNGRVTYNPPQNVSGMDQFNYAISDDDGDTATGTVVVVVVPPADGQPPNTIVLLPLANQSILLRFVSGDAGDYTIQWTEDLGHPAWADLPTTASPNGLFESTDSTATPVRFYQAASR